jgi:hypothetical protein
VPSRTHSVDTVKGAVPWLGTAMEADLPVRVIQWECGACGRYRANVLSARSGRTRTLPDGR